MNVFSCNKIIVSWVTVPMIWLKQKHWTGVYRVARYNQLSKEWKRDAFLRHSTGRPIVGYQAHFSVAHAGEQAVQRIRTQPKTSVARAPRRLSPNRYVAPTEKRRDDIRWETRVRMQLQD